MKALIFSILILPLFAMTIKERFANGHEGDYIVTEQNKLATFMRIETLSENRIVLEEISLPAHKAKRKNWLKWHGEGFPDATSHLLYEIDLEKGKCLQIYSPQRGARLNPETEQIFSSLITLPLKAIPSKRRKRIGPEPSEGMDMRKIWNPPIVQNGKKTSKVQCHAYRTRWPEDGSELAGKLFELYFHEKSPFPCWIEISNSAATFKIRLIDSGTTNLDKT